MGQKELDEAMARHLMEINGLTPKQSLRHVRRFMTWCEAQGFTRNQIDVARQRGVRSVFHVESTVAHSCRILQ